MSVYLDTCIVSEGLIASPNEEARLFNDVVALLELAWKRNVRFVTSAKTRDELAKIPDSKAAKRTLGLMLVTLLERVHHLTFVVEGGYGSSAYGQASYGGGSMESDETFDALRRVFDEADAVHVFNAVKSKCAYFLTDDRRSILSRAKSQPTVVGAMCGDLKFVNVTDLSAILAGELGLPSQ